MLDRVVDARQRLQAYVSAEQYAGWDPFDCLNSHAFLATPLRHSRFARLALLQAGKRSPLNFRKVLAVPKERNHKGTGLFLAAFARLYRQSSDAMLARQAEEFVAWLREGVSPGYHGACWGYNFDWQARAFFQPKGTPTVVATGFIANALLDAAETFGVPVAAELARSACDFVLEDLNRTVDGDAFCFSYSPEDRTAVYNASLLGTQLLARVGHRTGEQRLLDAARQSASFVLQRQRTDGAWVYGDLPFHCWVDSFHTGFMLDGLDDYARFTEDERAEQAVKRGLVYYKDHFFESDGLPKYYDDHAYPVDIHSAAQALVTLVRFGELDLACRVADWTLTHMQDSKGYFYYQVRSRHTNKIPYMRWSQAWMFRALVELEAALARRTPVMAQVER